MNRGNFVGTHWSDIKASLAFMLVIQKSLKILAMSSLPKITVRSGLKKGIVIYAEIVKGFHKVSFFLFSVSAVPYTPSAQRTGYL